MKFFLSGKIDAEHGAWRDAILGTVYEYESRRHRPRWELSVAEMSAPDEYPEWPVLKNCVLGLHDYVGPFRVTDRQSRDSSHEGYFHGSRWVGSHGVMDDESQALVVDRCKAAIRNADIIFAYINTPDAYGTIAEIGYAHAMGKYINLVIDNNAGWELDDYWFVEMLATRSDHASRESWSDGQSVRQGEVEFTKDRLRDALVYWTAYSQRRPAGRLALMEPSDRQVVEWAMRDLKTAEQVFAQITLWTSDPRVRNEAERMRKYLAR